MSIPAARYLRSIYGLHCVAGDCDRRGNCSSFVDNTRIKSRFCRRPASG